VKLLAGLLLTVVGLSAVFVLLGNDKAIEMRDVVERQLAASATTEMFEGWAFENSYFPASCQFDAKRQTWKFPCGMEPLEWMNEEAEHIICYSAPIHGPRDLADEFMVAFLAISSGKLERFAVAHVDQNWPTGTWDGALIPEDYGSRAWCEFKIEQE
jgi:hypothetical protein